MESTDRRTAILIVDMMSDFEFEDGEKLWPHAAAAAENIKLLKQRAKSHGAPVVYVNDNYGHWEEDFRSFVSRIKGSSSEGRRITDLLAPEENDLYVLKTQRSGFYETPLSILLQSLKVVNLIVCGVTTDICVLFTAHDAYMRGFRVFVPSDCSAAVETEYHSEALKLLERVASADTREQSSLDFNELEQQGGDHDIARRVPLVQTRLGDSGVR